VFENAVVRQCTELNFVYYCFNFASIIPFFSHAS
jgi:hypothetical protein